MEVSSTPFPFNFLVHLHFNLVGSLLAKVASQMMISSGGFQNVDSTRFSIELLDVSQLGKV